VKAGHPCSESVDIMQDLGDLQLNTKQQKEYFHQQNAVRQSISKKIMDTTKLHPPLMGWKSDTS